MYTHLRIQNFRGFKDLEVKDLARINLIGGKNNVGKTALLEAVAIHTGLYTPEILLRMDINKLRNQFVHPSRVEGLPGWSTLFTEFNDKSVIKISGDYYPDKQLSLFENEDTSYVHIAKTHIEDIPPENRIVRRLFRDGIIDENTNIDTLVFISDYHNLYYISNQDGRIVTDSLPPRRVPSIFLFSREKVSLEENAKRFSTLQRHRNQVTLLEVLRVIDKRIEKLELLYDGYPPVLYTDLGFKEPIPIPTMGDGLNRILSLILAMSAVENGGVIFIDEIENGLHHSIQEDIWKAIGKAATLFDVQVFATTHSLEMIRTAQQAFADTGEDDFRYYRLDRDINTNVPIIVKYSQNTMGAAVEMGYEVRG